jgi:hypothetical protein
MDWRTGRQTDQSTQPMRPIKKRVVTWIRPQQSSVEFRALTSEDLLPRRFKWSNIVRLGANLVGVSILCGSIWLMLPAFVRSHLPIGQRGVARECTTVQQCGVETTLPSVSFMHPSPNPDMPPTFGLISFPATSPTPRRSPTPTPSPLPLPSPTLSPMPTPSPTPSMALLQVMPTTLTLSYRKNCRNGQLASLQLTNAGGITLVWMEDNANTSRGLSIASPTETFVLLPGQSTRANVTCAPDAARGKNQVQVDFNGGTFTVIAMIS